MIHWPLLIVVGVLVCVVAVWHRTRRMERLLEGTLGIVRVRRGEHEHVEKEWWDRLRDENKKRRELEAQEEIGETQRAVEGAAERVRIQREQTELDTAARQAKPWTGDR